MASEHDLIPAIYLPGGIAPVELVWPDGMHRTIRADTIRRWVLWSEGQRT